MKKTIYFSVSLLLLGISLLAQPPQAIKYQAVARNSSGNLIQNQLVAFRIGILQGGPSGTLVYQERHTPTTNNYGLVNLEIGKGTVLFGTFSTINWDAGQMYLKVEFDPAGGTSYLNMGTSELLSVPYSLYSEKSSTSYWEKVGNSVFYSNGPVGIGTSAPNEQLELTGNLRLPATTPTAGIIKLGGSTFLHSYGMYNTFLGEDAGNLTMTGTHNTANGYHALSYNTTGTHNTACGFDAHYFNTTGTYNTALGAYAGVDLLTPNLTNATAIGANAKVASSNSIVLGSIGVNVGIGTTSPTHPLNVVSNQPCVAKIQNTSPQATIDGLAIQIGPLSNPQVGNEFVYFLDGDGTWLGSIRGNGSGGVEYYNASDSRLKGNIGETRRSIKDLMNIKVRDFNYKSAPDKIVTGFVAQELYEVYPEAVAVGSDDIEGNPWSVSKEVLIPLMVKSIQDQQNEIKELNAKNARIEARMMELEAIVRALANEKLISNQSN